MTNNVDAQETQGKLAAKLEAIAIRNIAIESMSEQIEELLEDLIEVYRKAGEKRSKAEVKMMADVYTDATKAKGEEEAKIDKSTQRLSKMEELEEELSVLDRFRTKDIYDAADRLIPTVLNPLL